MNMIKRANVSSDDRQVAKDEDFPANLQQMKLFADVV
jgi:hypothetical protein